MYGILGIENAVFFLGQKSIEEKIEEKVGRQRQGARVKKKRRKELY
jgi:hypothetical protein